ncbi:MAG: hypothetical protein HYR85_23425 [Planctomycetes bacterium]|nr:hypothetical protein [Planctomycetota bacterium]MBI3847073.1 hypothetical protein [Planctomycetota bacterium]
MTRKCIAGGGAVALVVAFALQATILTLGCRTAPHYANELRDASPPPVVDRDLEWARRYSPFVYQATDRKRGREDLPCNVDFDGDLIGNDNWENIERFRLTPTVYYASLETETHRFLTFHLFHPRDWAPIRLGLQDVHENDGENFQVVVEKASGRPVLLFAQAHYRGRAYARDRATFRDGDVRVRDSFVTLDDDGHPSPGGFHVAVFVESQGHGIYGTDDSCSRVSIDGIGRATFSKGSGLQLRAAHDDERVDEPRSFDSGVVPYRLESTTAKLWPLLVAGSLVGDGRLFDDPCRYHDSRLTIAKMPRTYDGNLYSGPLGNDRGISPFAVSFGFSSREVGALFFDPAARWQHALEIDGPWALDYVNDPFRGVVVH